MAPVKISLAILMLCSSLWAADSVSLQEVLEYATKNAKTLTLKELDAKIESKNVKAAKAGYYPTLGVVYNAEYNQALDGSSLSSEYVGGMTISNQTRYQSSMALQLNYDLYHFGATTKQVQIARQEQHVKQIEWCNAEKKLHEQILEKYADARKMILEKSYRHKMLIVRQKLYNAKERLYNAGQYSKVDLGDEAIAIIGLERDIENARMQYKEDIIRISQLSYMPIKVDDYLLPIGLQKIKKIIRLKFEKTPKGRELLERIKQKENEISLHTREELPSIALYSNYYFYSSHPTEYDYTISHFNKKSWNIGFALKYTIFSGFKSSSKKERLHLELMHLKEEFADARHNYKADIRSKTVKIAELNLLKKDELHLLKENGKKIEMLDRLRKEQRVDLLTRLNAEYELLQRTLNIETRKVDTAFERTSLSILQRGIKECTQH
jgi:outer membrane protein TolC